MSSQASASQKKSWLGTIGLAILFVVLAALVVPYAIEYYFPKAQEGVRMVAENADDFIETRSVEIERHTFADKKQYLKPNGEIDPNLWSDTGMEAANNVRDDVRRIKAVKARSKDEDESIPRIEVKGNQYSWITARNLNIPTHVTVPPTDMVKPHWRAAANADGNPWNPANHEYDETVLMNDQKKHFGRVIDAGRINMLIGRFCQSPDNCGPAFPMGTDSVLCVGPGLNEGGYLQTRHNGLEVTGSQEAPIDFARGLGQFVPTIKPDDPPNGQMFATDACRENPGALVVRNPQAPATTLVASK